MSEFRTISLFGAWLLSVDSIFLFFQRVVFAIFPASSSRLHRIHSLYVQLSFWCSNKTILRKHRFCLLSIERSPSIEVACMRPVSSYILCLSFLCLSTSVTPRIQYRLRDFLLIEEARLRMSFSTCFSSSMNTRIQVNQGVWSRIFSLSP